MSTFWVHPALDLPHNPTLRRIQTLRRHDPRFSVERSTVYTFDQVQEAIRTASWRQSKGYVREDGVTVGRHQYLVRQQQPEAYATIRWWIENNPDVYQGTYGGFTYTYWNYDGYRYWAGYGVILNRAALDDVAGDPVADALP